MMRLMLSRKTITGASALFLFLAVSAGAQTPQRQTQEDDYTRYELLAPDTAQFRILYEVTATTPARSSSSTRSARAALPATSASRT